MLLAFAGAGTLHSVPRANAEGLGEDEDGDGAADEEVEPELSQEDW